MRALLLLCWIAPMMTIYGQPLSEEFWNGRPVKFIVLGTDSCGVESVAIPRLDELFDWVTLNFVIREIGLLNSNN